MQIGSTAFLHSCIQFVRHEGFGARSAAEFGADRYDIYFRVILMVSFSSIICSGQIHAAVISASFGSTGALPGLVKIIAGVEAQPVVKFTVNTSIASGNFVSIRMPNLQLLSASSIVFTSTPASFAASATVNSTYNSVVLSASASISSGTVVTITFTAVATNPSSGTATGSWSVSTWDSSSNVVDSGSFAGYTTVAGASASSLFFVAKSSTTPTAPAINVGPVAPAFTFTLPMNLGSGATMTIEFPPSTNFTYSSTIISDVRLGSNSGLTAVVASPTSESVTLSNSIYTYTSTLNAASAGSISIYMNGGTGITLPISNFNPYSGTVGPFIVTIVSNGVTIVSQSLTATVPAGVIATSCSDSVVSFALSSTTWGAQSSFSASFRTTNIIPIGGSLVVTFPTEINTMFQNVLISSASVSSAYFGSGAACNLPSCTLPLKALVQIPANTVVSITISKSDGTAAFNVPSSPITSISFKFTFITSASQVVDTATVALTIGNNAYCTILVFNSPFFTLLFIFLFNLPQHTVPHPRIARLRWSRCVSWLARSPPSPPTAMAPSSSPPPRLH
jgi:hypothetical protein